MEDTAENPADNPKTTPKLTNTQIERLVVKAKAGDERALQTLLALLKSKHAYLASKYYFQGQDREDVLQQARIATWFAIRDYKPESGFNFESFALMCAKRRILTQIEAAGAKRYSALNSSISIDEEPDPNDEEAPVIGIQPDFVDELLNRDSEARGHEEFQEFCRQLLPKLKGKTRKVFEAASAGHSDLTYRELADCLGMNTKSVDNALWRARLRGKELVAEMAEKQAEGLAGVKTG